jgi:hypothetical protein
MLSRNSTQPHVAVSATHGSVHSPSFKTPTHANAHAGQALLVHSVKREILQTVNANVVVVVTDVLLVKSLIKTHANVNVPDVSHVLSQGSLTWTHVSVIATGSAVANKCSTFKAASVNVHWSHLL